MAERIGIYPGTFDPITLGHMDIIERGSKLVDRLIIGVTTNIAKSPMFSDDERIAIVKRELAGVSGNMSTGCSASPAMPSKTPKTAPFREGSRP